MTSASLGTPAGDDPPGRVEERGSSGASSVGPTDAGGRSGSTPLNVLACGADTDELLEQVALGHAGQLTTHQDDCVHCRAALQEFADLWAPVVASATAPVPVPDGFVDSVMTRVRSAAADTWYTLELTDGGKITIAARIVARLARNAARTVPGVRVALGRSTAAKLARIVERATLGHRHPNSAVGVLGRTAVVDLALAVTYGESAHRVAAHVQQAVVAELQRTVGLKSVTVNVSVDDVLDADS